MIFGSKNSRAPAHGALLVFVWGIGAFFGEKRLLSLTFDPDPEYNGLNK